MKQQKKFLTKHISGDQHGQSGSYLWSDALGHTKIADIIENQNYESIAVSFPYDPHVRYLKEQEKLKDEGYHQGVTPSNAQWLANAILDAIEKNNLKKFKEILSRNFIYAGKIDSFTNRTDASQGDWYHQHYEIHTVRPVIEVLFFEHPGHLAEIMRKLNEKNDLRFYQAFEICISQNQSVTDLSLHALYAWTAEMKQNALNNLQDLQHYGETVANTDHSPKAQQKANTIKTLSNNLNELIGKQAIHSNQADDYATKFATAAFKATFMQHVMQHHDELAQHRGYKRLIVNIIAAVCTVFIAQAIHYATSSNNNFWFFNRTTSQEKTHNILTHVGFSRKALGC